MSLINMSAAMESTSKQKPYEYAYRYSDTPAPASAKTCYKLVAICGGRFVSIYDGRTEYEVDITMHQQVTNDQTCRCTGTLRGTLS